MKTAALWVNYGLASKPWSFSCFILFDRPFSLLIYYICICFVSASGRFCCGNGPRPVYRRAEALPRKTGNGA